MSRKRLRRRAHAAGARLTSPPHFHGGSRPAFADGRDASTCCWLSASGASLSASPDREPRDPDADVPQQQVTRVRRRAVRVQKQVGRDSRQRPGGHPRCSRRPVAPFEQPIEQDQRRNQHRAVAEAAARITPNPGRPGRGQTERRQQRRESWDEQQRRAQRPIVAIAAQWRAQAARQPHGAQHDRSTEQREHRRERDRRIRGEVGPREPE